MLTSPDAFSLAVSRMRTEKRGTVTVEDFPAKAGRAPFRYARLLVRVAPVDARTVAADLTDLAIATRGHVNVFTFTFTDDLDIHLSVSLELPAEGRAA